MNQLRRFITASLVAMAAGGGLAGSALAWDATYANWDQLLKKHVAWNAAGVASSVSYRGFAADRADLGRVLAGFSAVTRAEYDNWPKDDRLAFLINAYNAFTIELILTRYPNLKSIRDLGSLIQSPWKKQFFELLGEPRSLDNVEHDMIRAPGVFNDPRIHMAVVCASVGCPALRPQAYVGARLDQQLDDGVRRFLRDGSRNRYDAATNRLEVSKIFDWYRQDFEKGYKGFSSREAFFAHYADALATDPASQQRLRDSKPALSFLDYDWSLNDRR